MQPEASLQRDRLYFAFGTGDEVTEGKYECKHQSDTDLAITNSGVPTTLSGTFGSGIALYVEQ